MTQPRLIVGGPARGRVEVPPSKSLSNRYLNLALLSPGETRIERLLSAEDTSVFLDALAALGCGVSTQAGEVRVSPKPTKSTAEVFCGASGTMLRFLTATLSTLPGAWRLDGTARLRERPLAALIEALQSLGAEIECLDQAGLAPLAIRGRTLRGGRILLPSAESSQYASAMMMAASRASGALEVELAAAVSRPYLDLTAQAVQDFGGSVEWSGSRLFRVVPGLVGCDRISVPGDYSSACYFAAGAALVGGAVELYHLRKGSRQGDRRFFEVLAKMGARGTWREEVLEVRGRGRLAAVDCDMSDIPDQVPTLAALAPFADGTTRIRNVAHLRLKESDRLAGMAKALRLAGAEVIETHDELVIPGVWAKRSPESNPVTLNPLNDHRLAMSFAVLGLGRQGVHVSDPEVVAKSYPGFWTDFDAVFGS